MSEGLEFTMELKGVDKLIASNKTYAKRLPGVVLNAVRRPLRRKVTRIKQRIKRESGLGKSIWGAKGKGVGLDKIVKLIKSKVSGDGTSLITGVSLKGLPVLIEQGGQIKPHIIKKAWGKVTANHPGAPVRAHGFARTEMSGAASEVLAAIRTDLDKLALKVFGKAA